MSLVSDYYQVLLDIGLFLFFVIGAKVAILFTIRVKRPHTMRSRSMLWTGFGAWWLISGLWQVFPWVVTKSSDALARDLYHNQPAWLVAWYHYFLTFWTAKPITWNILAVTFQILVGIMLLTEKDNLAGRISLVLAVIFSWSVWVVPEAFGSLLSSYSSLVTGTPGAGFIAGSIGLLLLVPTTIWESANIARNINRGLAILLGLAGVWQLNPWSGFFGPNIARMFAVSPVPRITHIIHTMMQFALSYSVALNSLLVIICLGLAFMVWKNNSRATLLIISGAFFLWLWLSGEGLGLIPAIGCNMSTAPLLFLLIIISTGDTTIKTRDANAS
ncbi:MAG: hypothetical protein C7B46_14240 [Sulfobacillus benefaciens]|uniref:Uncharacterized protein n=1 Tax=Sulfobacillus benefaciens TaxID=453960 RepID=A0A2T2XDE6_9FIRM|nr:MAG: hypothetical protein C7B46_14240 [Sulfobacillus benefaciens]